MSSSRRSFEPLVRFGATVRLHREAAGLSQEQLADRAGLHRTYLGGVERGERNLGLLNIFAIADALKLPASELFRVPSDHGDGKDTGEATSRGR